MGTLFASDVRELIGRLHGILTVAAATKVERLPAQEDVRTS